jgi:pyridoxal phosphate enzyme (YggS family)
MVRKDLKQFLSTIPDNVTIVAATKYVDANDLKLLLDNGVTNFGENRVEEFLNKYELLKGKDITWHFIGHLQRNKAKLIANKIDYLHSLDSLDLAKKLNDLREEVLPCFVEVSINREENKNGVLIEDLQHFLLKMQEFPKLKVIGLMMMTLNHSEENDQVEQFLKLKNLRDETEKTLGIFIPYLSMGMSGDYKSAIKCGATHIRLGRILFDMEY